MHIAQVGFTISVVSTNTMEDEDVADAFPRQVQTWADFKKKM